MSTYLHALGLVSPLGHGQAENLAALLASKPGLSPAPEGWLSRPAWVGRVRDPLPDIAGPLYSRNNQLLLAAARQIETDILAARAQFGSARIAVVIGTSTSGVGENETAAGQSEHATLPAEPQSYFRQEMGDPARFLAGHYKLDGPAYVISTACSSSARAMITARRLLNLNLADVVLVGGADSLCRLTLSGFAALESVSATPCQPFTAGRDGINIGEAAVLFIMQREPASIRLAGCGSSSDAHHISAPHPEGLGAAAAMQAALADAGMQPAEIDYLNLHGTATPLNDAMESRAVFDTFGEYQPKSGSTKCLTGHTLGAAGALEAAFCYLLLQNTEGGLPASHLGTTADPALPALNWIAAGETLRPRTAMSNSFAFGGNNASLILAREGN